MNKRFELHFLKKQKEKSTQTNIITNEHEVYLKGVKATKRRIVITRILILVIFIALWQIAASLKWIDPFLTSSPIRVIKSFVSLYEDGSRSEERRVGKECR